MTAPVPTKPTTATPSLQRRVTIIVVGLLTLLMVILGVVIEVSLDVQARRNLHDRLVAATSRADALVAAHTTPSQIAAELNGGSIRALLITSQGATYGDPAIRPDTTAGPATPLLPPPPHHHPAEGRAGGADRRRRGDHPHHPGARHLPLMHRRLQPGARQHLPSRGVHHPHRLAAHRHLRRRVAHRHRMPPPPPWCTRYPVGDESSSWPTQHRPRK
jgi:hypothetical protein